jgi:hypothetical protein
MANLGVRIEYEPLRSIGFAAISGAYAGIGTPFEHPARMVIITNTTDVDVYVSYNGVEDHSIIPSQTARVLDYGSNMALNGGASDQAAFTRVYTRAFVGLPTDGGVFVEVVYLDRGAS